MSLGCLGSTGPGVLLDIFAGLHRVQCVCTMCVHCCTVQDPLTLLETPQPRVRLLQVMNCSVFINHAKLSALRET